MASTLDILTDLQNCWCAQLANTIKGSPAQCCISATAPVIASCCDGAAWVRLVDAYPSKAFPSSYGVPDRCRVDTWAGRFEIGISRCAPQPCQVTGQVCCSEDLEAAQIQISDFEAMRRLFSCCLSVVTHDEIVVGNYNLQDGGGCTYATMQVTIRIADYCGC